MKQWMGASPPVAFNLIMLGWNTQDDIMETVTG